MNKETVIFTTEKENLKLPWKASVKHQIRKKSNLGHASRHSKKIYVLLDHIIVSDLDGWFEFLSEEEYEGNDPEWDKVCFCFEGAHFFLEEISRTVVHELIHLDPVWNSFHSECEERIVEEMTSTLFDNKKRKHVLKVK